MTRNRHGNAGASDISRRPNRCMAHHRSIAYHPTNRNHAGAEERDFSPPDEDSKSEHGDKKPRKRNSVACNRCRKRKIKCTGDQHNGNGCEACQTAGTSQHCFYLRVNSHQLDNVPIQLPQDCEWPYSTAAPTAYPSAVPRSTTDPSRYALAGGMLPTSSANTYPLQPTIRSQQYSDSSSTIYAPATPRTPFPPGYQPNLYPNQHSEQFVSHPGRNAMPYQLAQSPSVHLPPASLGPHWTTLPPSGRQPSNNPAFDPNLSPSYPSPGYSYLPSGGASYPPNPGEAPSVFPGLSPLAANLPYNSNPRTLPNPASGQSSLQSGNSLSQENDGGLGLFPEHVDTSTESWDFPGTSRGSVSSATQDTISASDLTSNASSSSPGDTHGSSSLAYGHLSHTSLVGSDASASAINSGNVSRRMSDDDSYTAMAPTLSASHVGHDQLSNLNSSFNMQNMRGFGIADDSITTVSPTSSLVSAQAPSGIIHPQPQYSGSLEVPSVLKGSPEVSTQRRKGSHQKAKGLRSHGLR